MIWLRMSFIFVLALVFLSSSSSSGKREIGVVQQIHGDLSNVPPAVVTSESAANKPAAPSFSSHTNPRVLDSGPSSGGAGH